MADPRSPFTLHLFACTNQRPPGSRRGCCAEKGSEAVRRLLKELIDEHGLKGKVRANAAGCLDFCERGPVLVVYPEGVWYQRVTPEAAAEIFRSHVLGGVPVEEHRMGPADFEEIARLRAASRKEE